MKFVSTLLFMFGIASCALAQYGIPDDDDDIVPAVIPSPLQAYSTQPQQRQQFFREEPSYSLNPIRIQVEKQNDIQYEQPAQVLIRSEPQEAYYAQPVRENLQSYNAPSQSVRFEDSYSSQPAYSAGLRKEAVPIVKYVMDSDHFGTFNLETVSGDGTTNVKSGQLKNLGDEEGPVQVMSGSYSFTGDDGKLYKVDWIADENGFSARGDHLPTTPAPIF